MPTSIAIINEDPAVASGDVNRLDVFVKSIGNNLMHKWWDGSTWSSGWKSLGGNLASSPGVVSRGKDRIDVFVRGTDNALWHILWDGIRWQEWVSHGGSLTSAPAAVSWDGNRIDVFVRGPDFALWRKAWDGKWLDWENLGGYLASAPSAISREKNSIDVFFKGIDNDLASCYWDGSKWRWGSLKGVLTSAPAAASWGPDRIDVFARGTDNALWRIWWDGTWQKWESLGGVLKSAPAAVSRGQDKIDVFFIGADNDLQSCWWDKNKSKWRWGSLADKPKMMKYLVQPVIDGATNFPGRNPNKIYWIASINSGLVASVNGNAVELVQKNWTENVKQQWKFEPLTGADAGYYRIVSVMNSSVLTRRGENVALKTWNSTPEQCWRLNNLGYGKFRIESKADDLLLDVTGSSIWEGAKIVLNKLTDKRELKAVIYEHKKFAGRSQELGIGKYNLNLLTIGNDVVSSLKVPPGLGVILFEDSNFRGESKTFFTGEVDDLGGFNDKASSIIVADTSKFITIYSKHKYGGDSQSLGVGQHGEGDIIEELKKDISSIKVPEGLTVTLYPNSDLTGDSRTITVSTDFKDDKFNDKTRSLVVSLAENSVQSLGPGAILSQQWLLAEICENKLESTYNKKVTIYEHKDFEGLSQELSPGSYLKKDLKIGNKKLSSLKVPEGIRVTIFSEDNFRGRTGSFHEDKSYVGLLFNDLASSILVEPAVRIYSEPNFGGRMETIGVGNYELSQMRIGAGAVSSIKVPQGLIVTLYKEPNCNGPTRTFLEDTAYIVDGFDNMASSLMVKAMGVMIPDKAITFGSKISLRANRTYLGESQLHDALEYKDNCYTYLYSDDRYAQDKHNLMSAGYPYCDLNHQHYTIIRAGDSKHQSYLSYGDVISLMSYDGKFLSAERCAFNKDSPMQSELFVIFRAGDTKDKNFVSSGDMIGLMSSGHKFMSSLPDGVCKFDKDSINEFERWKIGLISSPSAAVAGGAGGAVAGGGAGSAVAGEGACGVAAEGGAGGSATGGGAGGAVAGGGGVCGAAVGGGACVEAACGAAACAWDFCGIAACGAAAGIATACDIAAAGAAICLADVAGIGGCGVAATGWGASVAAACGAAACNIAAGGLGACGADACGLAVCGAAACGAAACGAAACGGDACPVDVALADACAAEASVIEACAADACAANVCAINVCPADACAADACAIDVIPIIPFI